MGTERRQDPRTFRKLATDDRQHDGASPLLLSLSYGLSDSEMVTMFEVLPGR